jgi:hypothetical protein
VDAGYQKCDVNFDMSQREANEFPSWKDSHMLLAVIIAMERIFIDPWDYGSITRNPIANIRTSHLPNKSPLLSIPTPFDSSIIHKVRRVFICRPLPPPPTSCFSINHSASCSIQDICCRAKYQTNLPLLHSETRQFFFSHHPCATRHVYSCFN